MNTILKLVLGALLLLGVAAGGYWLGTHSGTTASTAPAERKVQYYRNPMGLPDTSPVPKKDAMGMDYVPVYEGEAQAADNAITISPDRVQKLGVKGEVVTLRELKQTLQVTGRIEVDERRTYTVAPKFEGWVERLYVNATGQAITKGQPLFDVYSPDLVSAQREHALAVQGLAALKDADEDARRSMQHLAESSGARLQNWDIAPQSAPARTEVRPRVTFRAPVSGVVLEKKAVQGMRFMAGEMLYQIADLSSVWVIADVPEQDVGNVTLGSPVQVAVDAYPEHKFAGRVGFVYPTLDAATRTVQVRMEIANPRELLKPAMFARVQIAGHGRKVLTVPTSAVIDSGMRQVVLVRLAEGRFEPRTVTLGQHGDDYAEVLGGIAEGEQVVTSANFLIDAESNLKAALDGLGERTTNPGAAAAEHAAHAAPAQLAHKTVGHEAQGILEAIHDDGTVSITHEPIKSLGWPGMTMDFQLANSSLVRDIPPGSAVSFEIVERKPDEWVVTRMSVRTSQEVSHAEHRH